MNSIKKIQLPIRDEIQEFDRYFRKTIKSNVRLLDIINQYILRRKGKELRPMLVFLSAKFCGNATKKTNVAASLAQLLHTATLVHDDVVDDAQTRRGIFSVNALWKSKAAVLVGDFLLSKGMLVALDNKAYDLLHLFSDAVREMSEGELLQAEKARRLDISEEIYFEIIRKKTARLIAACAASGAMSVGAEEKNIKKMYDFGLNLGMAFQLKDDLLDFEKSNMLGKPVFNDIKEKKMTLPLIHALSKMPLKEKKKTLRTIKRHNTNLPKIENLVKKIVQFEGLEYAKQKMLSYKQKAILQLSSFPDSNLKDALKELTAYSVERKK